MKMTKPIKNIVLVDDEEMYAQGVKDYLLQKSNDYNIEYYSSGEECLANLHQNPDLIILDYSLKSSGKSSDKDATLDGLGTLRKIKGQNVNIPVIMLSGRDSAEVAANTIKYDAYDYVVKSESAFVKLDINIKNLSRQNFFNYILKYRKLFVLAFILAIILFDLGLIYLFGMEDLNIRGFIPKER